MPDDLSDAQIALLCDIEEHDLSKLIGDKKRDLEQLLRRWLRGTGKRRPGINPKAHGQRHGVPFRTRRRVE